MKIICDRCGEIKNQEFEIKLGFQKLCIKCLAADTTSKMKCPKEEIKNSDLKRRIERLEEINGVQK